MYCLENASPLYIDFRTDFNKANGDLQNWYSIWEQLLKDGMKNRITAVLFRVRAKIKNDTHTTEDLKPDPNPGKWDRVNTRAENAEGYRTFYTYNEYITPYLDELIAAEPGLKGKGITASSSIKDLRNAGVRVYEDGYMYYIHWITDQNYQYMWNYDDEADEGDKFNFYAVMRNTRYEVKVSTVKRIGMDLPGREVLVRDGSTYDVIEGDDYLLMPTNTSHWNFDKNDYLNKLKNKNI